VAISKTLDVLFAERFDVGALRSELGLD